MLRVQWLLVPFPLPDSFPNADRTNYQSEPAADPVPDHRSNSRAIHHDVHERAFLRGECLRELGWGLLLDERRVLSVRGERV